MADLPILTTPVKRELEVDSEDELEIKVSPLAKKSKSRAREEVVPEPVTPQRTAPAPYTEAELALARRVISPSGLQGRSVIWDRQIKTSNTTKAKSLYKVNDAYLHSLDREESRNARGYKMYLYSEHQVQQAAYNQRGGVYAFKTYLQSLYETATRKAENSPGGSVPKPLDDNKAPLKPVPYQKKAAPKSWIDSTHVAQAAARYDSDDYRRWY